MPVYGNLDRVENMIYESGMHRIQDIVQHRPFMSCNPPLKDKRSLFLVFLWEKDYSRWMD